MSLLQSRLQAFRNVAQPIDEPVISQAPVSAKQILWRQVKDSVMQEAVDVLDVESMEKMSGDERDKYLKEEIGTLVVKCVQSLDAALTRTDSLRLINEIVSEISGYGPITPLLEDDTINEVMVNGANQIYVERQGRIELTDIVFRDDDHVMHLIHRIVAPLGKRIDESSPMVDGRLPDGSRFNATIPPISLTGPVLTIRKFSATPLSMSDLIGFGTLSSNMAMFLRACVEGRLNIVVGGGTGSGKTTTLNVLSSLIPSNERIITIEDAAELSLQQEHVVSLETRPVNVEGKGSITIRDLVINSLRMRPDRIVVGEVRGGEALDMLQAMNTGHDGSLTTAHANSPRDILSRLETMVLMAGMDLPVKAIRDQIASAIDLIVYQARFKDGSRKITAITEVAGMEGDIITLQDLFIFDEQGTGERGKVAGSFRATGVIPRCLARLNTAGIHVPRDIFA